MNSLECGHQPTPLLWGGCAVWPRTMKDCGSLAIATRPGCVSPACDRRSSCTTTSERSSAGPVETLAASTHSASGLERLLPRLVLSNTRSRWVPKRKRFLSSLLRYCPTGEKRQGELINRSMIAYLSACESAAAHGRRGVVPTLIKT